MNSLRDLKRLYEKAPLGLNLMAMGFTTIGILIAIIFQLGCVTC